MTDTFNHLKSSDSLPIKLGTKGTDETIALVLFFRGLIRLFTFLASIGNAITLVKVQVELVHFIFVCNLWILLFAFSCLWL